MLVGDAVRSNEVLHVLLDTQRQASDSSDPDVIVFLAESVQLAKRRHGVPHGDQLNILGKPVLHPLVIPGSANMVTDDIEREGGPDVFVVFCQPRRVVSAVYGFTRLVCRERARIYEQVKVSSLSSLHSRLESLWVCVGDKGSRPVWPELARH